MIRVGRRLVVGQVTLNTVGRDAAMIERGSLPGRRAVTRFAVR